MPKLTTLESTIVKVHPHYSDTLQNEKIRMSSLDAFAKKFDDIRGLWCFNYQLDINELKDSLSKVLSLYPFLAGRIVQTESKELAINCCNAGVCFTVSQFLDSNNNNNSDSENSDKNNKNNKNDKNNNKSIFNFINSHSTTTNNTSRSSHFSNSDFTAETQLVSDFVPNLTFKLDVGPLASIHVVHMNSSSSSSLLSKKTFLGVSILHCVADGFTYFHFINTWAKIHSNPSLLSAIPRPIVDRTLLDVSEVRKESNKEDKNHQQDSLVSPLGGAAVYSRFRSVWSFSQLFYHSFSTTGRAFHFSKLELENMKRAASIGMDSSDSGCYITTAEALMAHFWQVLTLLQQQQQQQSLSSFLTSSITKTIKTSQLSETSKISIAATFRSRKSSLKDFCSKIENANENEPAESKVFAGNAILFPSTSLGTNELASQPLYKVTQHIHTLLDKFKSPTGLEIDSEISWFNHQLATGAMNKVSIDANPQSNDFLVTHWTNFNVYGCDFGKGKPFLFIPGLAPFPGVGIICSPPPELDGVVFYVSTSPTQARVLDTEPWRLWIHRYRSELA